MGIFRKLIRKPPAVAEGTLLPEGLVPLFSAPTIKAKQKIIQKHPNLLMDSTLRILEEVAAAASQIREAQGFLLAQHALLRRCHEIGIEAAFAEVEWHEVIEEIMKGLDSLSKPNEMPKRVKLCQRALEHVKREKDPGLWAAFQFELADSLAWSPRGNRGKNQERAISAYEAALQVHTREAMPDKWARTQAHMAVVYHARIRGDRAENLERAISGYKAALQVHTPEAMPAEWAETQMNLARAFVRRIRGDEAENRERAMTSYEAALEVMAREVMPVECVKAQTNVQKFYSRRTLLDLTESLERAIASYEQPPVDRGTGSDAGRGI